MGHIYAFMSCTRLETTDDADHRRECHGWVDPSRCRTTLWDSRHEVRPVVDWAESTVLLYYESYEEMVRDNVLAALCELTAGYVDNGDGTYTSTAAESALDPDDRGTYHYEIHFIRRAHGPDGWTESSWHPDRDGGVRP